MTTTKPVGLKTFKTLQYYERDVAQWLERGALPKSLPAVRFRIPLGAGFSEKYHVSPLSILGHYFDVAPLGKTLYPHMLHLTEYLVGQRWLSTIPSPDTPLRRTAK